MTARSSSIASTSKGSVDAVKSIDDWVQSQLEGFDRALYWMSLGAVCLIAAWAVLAEVFG